MNFFRRRTTEKTTTPTINPEATASPAPTNVPVPSQDCTPEEAAQQWFAARFNTEMPEELTRMFRHMAQVEAKRQKVGETLLTATELRNIQERIRLCQTKLTNITQALAGLQAQKEWLHKYKLLKGTLDKHKQANFESNKQYSSRLQDIRELERFENFESIQGDFQQIKVRENLLQELRQEASENTRKSETPLQEIKDTGKQKEQDNKKYQECKNNVKLMQKAVAGGYRMQAELKMHEENLKELSEYKEQTEVVLAELRKRVKELAIELQKAQEKHASLQQQRQNLASQQKMLEKGEVIQAWLEFLQNMESVRTTLQANLEQTLRKQHEQDEKLNKLFSQSQELDAEIKTLQSELRVHQKSILGMNSYNLQQRAMDLKSNKEQLTNASSLWKQISEGYTLIDEKGQEITRMRHHNEALRNQISTLETEVAGLQTQCEELKYAYTLSKSQDVMQLRKDLREGTNCSVCGATHHPYHSDTLLEQSKLIGEFKTEFEHVSTELKHKKTLLADLKKEQATEEGRIETAYQALGIYKQILQENVNHWANFASLDRSFKECSQSTNFDGRRIMLQQLLEKTGVDAEYAQKELDTFNFHQSNINAINEQLNRKELEKNDITTRLNEVNTGCQVVAHRVEQLQKDLSQNNASFSELYERIDKMMTISNWYKVWKENPETLRIYIQQQMAQWFELKEELNKSHNACTSLQIQLEMTEQNFDALGKQNIFIAEKIEQTSECRTQTHDYLYKTFPDGDVEAYSKEALEAMFGAEEQKELSAEASCKAQKDNAWHAGYQQHVADQTQQMEEQIAKRKSDLDFWIRKYNANHSPVQFNELEQTFRNPTDWNTLREEIRTLTVNKLVTEARTEEARLALAAHQVNAFSQGQEKEDRTAALNAEIARLESEQNQILTKMAGYRAQLEAHELGLQKLAAGKNGQTE